MFTALTFRCPQGGLVHASCANAGTRGLRRHPRPAPKPGRRSTGYQTDSRHSERRRRQPCGWRLGSRNGGDGGESNSPSRTLSRGPLRACPMICRRARHPASAPCGELQSRPLSGFAPGYVTLPGSASPLNDASTAHGDEAASTLTLLPKQRGREQAGGCQLLRFAVSLTRPDGTSARVPRESGPVETTHPQGRKDSSPTGRAEYDLRPDTCGYD